MRPKPLSDARSAWWDARLENWALWRTGSGRGLGAATDGMFGGDFSRPPPPLVGEALDIDRLVTQLELRLQDALRARYIWTGTLEERAGYLGVHRNTLANQVDEAKGVLDGLWWVQRNQRGRADQVLACAGIK